MVRKQQQLNAKMREIIRVLHKKGGAMTAHEVAEETGFSYTTVVKYITQLLMDDVLIKDGKKNNKKKNH